MPDSPVIEAVNRFRAQVLAKDAAALGRMARTYAGIARRLEGLIDALTMDIGDKQPTRGQLVRMQRYRALLGQVGDELQGFQGVVRTEVDGAIDFGIRNGQAHARELLSTTIAGDASIAARFNVLPRDAIEAIVGFLGPESPLYDRISDLAPYTAERVSRSIIEGVGLGYNPRKIATAINGALGQGLASALRLTRTVQLYSYRESTRAAYVANDDVVEGWYWHAQLDSGTCVSCINMHGTLHPLSEQLNDHHNGRCAMVPAVRGFPPVVEQTGQEWFEQQPENAQRQMMGKGRFEAWRDGQFRFDQLTSTYDDGVYGTMRREATLGELRDDKWQRHGRLQPESNR